MEPRPYGRGDLSEKWQAQDQRLALQWSRARMDAETTLKEQMAAQHAKASMEPRPYGRGDQGGNGRTQEALLASMEPRPYGRGDSQADRDHDVAMALQWGRARVDAETSQKPAGVYVPEVASMGPRPCGRGDAICIGLTAPSFSSFNGAAPVWTRRLAHQGRNGGRPPGFNGAAPVWTRRRVTPGSGVFTSSQLQWGRARVDAETRCTSASAPSPKPCFNGAAPVWTRRPAIQRGCCGWNP